MSDFLGQLIARSFDRAEAMRPRPVALFEPSQSARGFPLPPGEEPEDGAAPAPVPAAARRPTSEPRHVPASASPSLRLQPGAPAPPPDAPPVFAPHAPALSPPPAQPAPLQPPHATPMEQTLLQPVSREAVVEQSVERQPLPPPPAAPSIIEQTLLQPVSREIVVERVVEAARQSEAPRREGPLLPARPQERRDAPPAAEVLRPEPAPFPRFETATPIVVQPRVERARRQAATPPPAATPPTIHVTIGRVEVRASSPPVVPVRRPRPQPAVMSLDEYLKQRASGGQR